MVMVVMVTAGEVKSLIDNSGDGDDGGWNGRDGDGNTRKIELFMNYA